MALLFAAAGAWAAPLSVLLTNDDGYDAPGLAALRTALLAAGHRVTVVAPLRQQSGSGVRLTLGELNVQAEGEGAWAVDGSPADAVAVGLTRLLPARPDLVVSGANLGQNLGANVVSSGTVGAAVMAVQFGVPAIAVSVGLDLEEARATPAPFPSTTAAYPLAASTVVRLVERLAAAARGGPLLPPDTLLNVNVPARPVMGVALVPLGARGGFRFDYPQVSEGRVRVALDVDPDGARDADSDTGRFAAGWITLSVLRPGWAAEGTRAAEVATRLGDVAGLAPAAP
ncbi:MAG: 5'/3'-nucleotidase SurE [Gammaproteobacteria bacterium]